MKAAVYNTYGSPEVLQLKDIQKPIPKDNEVLVKIFAASVNSWDWDLLRGKPKIYRLIFGLFRPKYHILGADVAGRIEAVGKNITQFKSGDEVFGDLSVCGWGGFAEYVCCPETALTKKPANMTFVEAAAIPQAGVMALQGIRDYGQVQPGQKVLINGAGGGVGTFAIQMAKSNGAEVTGVDRTEKLEFMKSIGADHVIDFTKEDFTKSGKKYDLILDVMAFHSAFDYNRALNLRGKYVIVGGAVSSILHILTIGSFMSMTGTQKFRILMHKPNKDLDFLKELYKKGTIRPVIDRQYPLHKVPEALRYLGEGKVKGKVVITVEKET